MSNELTTTTNNNLLPSQVEFQMLQVIAKNAQDSGLYAGMGQQSKILMVLLAARELGVSPMLALNGGIWNIQGKIEISARLMNGLIRRAGHSIHIVRSDDEVCTLKGSRSDGDSFEVTFSKDDAIKAGLWGSNTWKKYPADMLYNRCMSRLARRLFSDVIGNAYVEGEIREAKAVENLEQAECEDITQNKKAECEKLTHDTKPDHFQPDTNLTQDPKISSEQLDVLMIAYAKTTQDFRENMEKYIAKEWNVKELEDLPAIHFQKIMNWIAKNMEMQAMAVQQ